MPRIRTIKPEFWCDEKLSCLPAIDRLVFLGLIGMADDYGRLHDNIKVIDAFVFPNSSETVRESVANLSRIGRVRRGNCSNGAKVIEIVNWSKHQRVDKPQNHLALPPIDKKTLETPGNIAIPEPFANHSGIVPEKVATLPGSEATREQTTRDQGSGTKEEEHWKIPPLLDSQKTRDLLAQFAQMRSSIKKPIRDLARASIVLKQFDNTEHLHFALETCIANEYQGLKPTYRPEQQRANSNGKPKQPSLDEILGVKR
jgi:hypothetical protein